MVSKVSSSKSSSSSRERRGREIETGKWVVEWSVVGKCLGMGMGLMGTDAGWLFGWAGVEPVAARRLSRRFKYLDLHQNTAPGRPSGWARHPSWMVDWDERTGDAAALLYYCRCSCRVVELNNHLSFLRVDRLASRMRR